MADGFRFEIDARDGDARVGRIYTPHGCVDTPAFMPVATYGAVRGLGPMDLEAVGAQILLANTYHLHERPGEDVVASVGGLHGFTGWRGPWLTDSGGYQITSLSERVHIAEQGVTFSSPLDGRRRTLTPELAVTIQEALGADIAMALDECRRPDAPDAGQMAEAAMERSLRWAARCRAARSRADQAQFGIVQGGVSQPLRERSARATAEIGFEGFAHGGLGLGEEAACRDAMVAAAHSLLPDDAPRYLMGLGRPEDLIRGVERGVDLFDCVVPTRHGRHGVLFTSEGELQIKNARFARDDGPPDPSCQCPTCRLHSRAYLRHLLGSGEVLGARLASIHNLHFYMRTLSRARKAIATGSFASLRDEVLALARSAAP